MMFSFYFVDWLWKWKIILPFHRHFNELQSKSFHFISYPFPLKSTGSHRTYQVCTGFPIHSIVSVYSHHWLLYIRHSNKRRYHSIFTDLSFNDVFILSFKDSPNSAISDSQRTKERWPRSFSSFLFRLFFFLLIARGMTADVILLFRSARPSAESLRLEPRDTSRQRRRQWSSR